MSTPKSKPESKPRPGKPTPAPAAPDPSNSNEKTIEKLIFLSQLETFVLLILVVIQILSFLK